MEFIFEYEAIPGDMAEASSFLKRRNRSRALFSLLSFGYVALSFSTHWFDGAGIDMERLLVAFVVFILGFAFSLVFLGAPSSYKKPAFSKTACRFGFGESGIAYGNKSDQVSVELNSAISDVCLVGETELAFCFLLGWAYVVALPKRVFKNDSEMGEFKKYVASVVPKEKTDFFD